MNVCDIMTKDVEAVAPEESLFDAAEKMRTADTGALPVTSDDGTVLGVLTDRDIVLRAVAEGTDPKLVRVGDVMTPGAVTCRPDCPVNAAVDTMRDKQIRRLVVTEEDDTKVIGMLSLGDIAVRTEEAQLVGAATEGVCQPCV
jgi:CBS domain-containing protein